MRMKALHERRRQRMAAQRTAEENLERDLQQMEEEEKAEAAAKGKGRGKRKRSEAEEKEEAEFGEDNENSQGTRVSSRISRARQQDRSASKTDRRRSTRNASLTTASTPAAAGEEEWQQLPPEWIKSEQEEREDDPDFGQENGAASASESELSMLEDEDGDVVRASTRSSQRRTSPRKTREPPRVAQRTRNKVKAKGATDESELSELSDVDGMSLDEEEDENEDDDNASVAAAIALEEPAGSYPDSAWDSYTGLPSFDDEDNDLPADFVRWELVIQDLPEWLEFEQKLFPDTEDANERALITWVEQYVQPRVRDELARREEVRKKEESARKAAERKARLAVEKSQEASPAPSASAPANKFRSSRIAQREAREADERAKALAEERARQAEEAIRNPGSVPSISLGQADAPENDVDKKVFESDRRAARARQREEDRKAREEADLAAALRESAAEEGDQPDEAMPAAEFGQPPLQAPVPVSNSNDATLQHQCEFLS